jgi:hypothetical protein
MAAALDGGAVPFVLAKLTLVSGGVLVLWRNRSRGIALAGAMVIFGAYASVMLWHVQSVQMLAALVR